MDKPPALPGRLPEFDICGNIRKSSKYAASQVVGYIKGKSAIHIARTYTEHRHNFIGQNFLARGYFVSTVGRDEETISKYIKRQEKADKRIDQLKLF